MINLCTNKLHLPRLKAVVHMHVTSGGHSTIDVATGLTPATFLVPEEIFVTGSMVDNVARDVGDHFVANGETKKTSHEARSRLIHNAENIRARSQSTTRT